MSFFIMVIVAFMLIPMGTMVLMKTLRTFRPFEFMPFAGTKGKNKEDWEQGKTFHHAPLSLFHVKRNTGSVRSFGDIS